MVIHPQARTTPKLRAEIKAQRDRKQVDLAKQYNVTPQTIRKWQNRDEFTDKSHRPHRLQTKLSEHQEMLVVELRKLLLLPLDDLLVIVREFIHPEATRSGIHRTLRRHGVSNLNALLRAENEEEAQPAKRKTFKDYAPGFVHVDVKYLPQMADESRRTYLFVAIDRATRWVYLEILPDKSARSAKGFLKQLIKKAPFIITRVLTDQACLRPRERFWDIPVPKIDSAFDNLLVPQPSWSPSTTQQLRKLVAAPYLAPNDWTPRSEAYFVFPLAQGTPGKQVLTDNGKEFTDRFIANGERKPTGQHPFDQVCQAEGIEHRLIKPKHPQTNGMVERFNGRISEILATTHFDASRDLQETLYQYQKIYNYHVPQKNIGHITPIQALNSTLSYSKLHKWQGEDIMQHIVLKG